MGIQVQNLLNEKARKFGASATSSDFQQIFVDAVNYALGDIDNLLLTTTAAIEPATETIDLDEQMYRPAVSALVDYYIGAQGQWTVKNTGEIYAMAQRKLTDLQTRYQTGLDLTPRFGSL